MMELDLVTLTILANYAGRCIQNIRLKVKIYLLLQVLSISIFYGVTMFAFYWKKLVTEFSPTIPPIGNNHGWDLIDGTLPRAIMTEKLPAPEFSVDLTSCKCKKSKCGTKMCSCLRNGLKCTEVCLCDDCTNTDETGIFFKSWRLKWVGNLSVHHIYFIEYGR